MSGNSSQHKTVTRTVRLDVDLDNALSQLANESNMSANFLMNRAVRRLVNWESRAERFGFVELPMTVHRKTFSYLSEEEARELGRWAAENFAKEVIALWFKRLSFETAIKALELLGSEYARVFQLTHETRGASHTIVIRHGGGTNMSSFYEEFIETIFKHVAGTTVNLTNCTENLMTANLTLKDTEPPTRILLTNLDPSDSLRHTFHAG